jgi:hypothetical protein
VSVCLPNIREDKALSRQQHLGRCLNLPISMESSGDFKMLTDSDRQRAELAIQEFHQIRTLHTELCKLILLPDRNIKVLDNKSQLTDRVIDEIDIYICEYKDILKAEVKVTLLKTIKTLKVGSLAYKGLRLLMKSVLEKSPFKQVKQYSEGINFILRCVEYAILLNPSKIDEILELDQIKLIVSRTIEHQFLSESDLKAKGISSNKRHKILDYIDSAKSDALAIQQKLEGVGELACSQVMHIEVDGETIYLNPDSAERKAIQRLKDIDDPEQWITAVDRDEEVDLEDLDKLIKESGYLV